MLNAASAFALRAAFREAEASSRPRSLVLFNVIDGSQGMSGLNTRSIKDMVKDNQKVSFLFYRDGQLWYSTECGFEFPVPISEAGTATFFAQDRAILFMRYIRKYIEYLQKSMQEHQSARLRDS